MLKIRMAELVEQYLGMPFGIALNIIYTIVILLFLMILNPIITTWVSRYFAVMTKKQLSATSFLLLFDYWAGPPSYASGYLVSQV